MGGHHLHGGREHCLRGGKHRIRGGSTVYVGEHYLRGGAPSLWGDHDDSIDDMTSSMKGGPARLLKYHGLCWASTLAGVDIRGGPPCPPPPCLQAQQNADAVVSGQVEAGHAGDV